jgi:hypothetical protein
MKIKNIQNFIKLIDPHDDQSNMETACREAYLKELKISIQKPNRLFEIILNSESMERVKEEF